MDVPANVPEAEWLRRRVAELEAEVRHLRESLALAEYRAGRDLPAPPPARLPGGTPS